MTARRKYVRDQNQTVIAVQLALDTAGFTYHKWGGIQTCKAGDWIVNSGGDIYTVDKESFARTYREVGRGTYMKTSTVWAEVAREAGRVQTKEGLTEYHAGDYLVFNEEDGVDAYAMAADRFTSLYRPVD